MLAWRKHSSKENYEDCVMDAGGVMNKMTQNL